MTTAVKISYALMVAFMLGIIVFHMGHVLLAAMFSFLVMEAIFRAIRRRMRPAVARLIAACGFVVAASAVIAIFAHFIAQTVKTFPSIVENSMPQISAIAGRFGFSLPFENFQDLREFLNGKLVSHAIDITKASSLLTREVFHMVIAVFAAVFFFVSGKPPEYKQNLFDAVRKETNNRIRKFTYSFERIFGAQIIISSINTVLTITFLYIMAIPHLAFLSSMTFIIGIMPIIGNIITNTVIVFTALGISINEAAIALLFLIAIHKLEYFLNSKIMGSSINIPMWQMLLAILIGNVVMGISGIMLAPAFLHYIKSELQAIPWAFGKTEHQKA